MSKHPDVDGLLVGSKEAAEILGIPVPNFHNWKNREDFPTPATTVGQGALWWKDDIEAYVDVRKSAQTEKAVERLEGALTGLDDDTRRAVLAALTGTR